MHICNRCKNYIEDTAKICNYCGLEQKNNQYVAPLENNSINQNSTYNNDFYCFYGEECKEKTFAEATLDTIINTFNFKKRTRKEDYKKALKFYNYAYSVFGIIIAIGIFIFIYLTKNNRIEATEQNAYIFMIVLSSIVACGLLCIVSREALIRRRANDINLDPKKLRRLGMPDYNIGIETILSEKDGVPYETKFGPNPKYKNIRMYCYKDIN